MGKNNMSTISEEETKKIYEDYKETKERVDNACKSVIYESVKTLTFPDFG